MKKELSGQHFATNTDVIGAVEAYLEDQDSSFYKEGICKLHNHWNKCVNLQGDYVEKKKVSVYQKKIFYHRPQISQPPLVMWDPLTLSK